MSPSRSKAPTGGARARRRSLRLERREGVLRHVHVEARSEDQGLTLLDPSCLDCDRDDDGMIDTQVANLGFCYCLTVHRAQRSEWLRVAVIDDYLGGDKARLAHAAATRARNTPIWVG